MSIFKKLLVISIALLLISCAQTSVRHHQDFMHIAKTVDTVVIVPADVEIKLIKFDGDNELLEDKSKSLQLQLHSLAAKKLRTEGLRVIDFDFPKEIAKDPEFAYALTQAREAWVTAKEEMYARGMVPEEEKANFQTNLGSVLNIIADKTDADAALLMQYTGFEKSKGVVAKDVASSVLIGILTMGAVIPVQATQGSFIDIALVDTASGKVIWANRKSGAGANSGNAELAFREFPDLLWESELNESSNITAPSLEN